MLAEVCGAPEPEAPAFVCGPTGFVEAVADGARRARIRARPDPHGAVRPDGRMRWRAADLRLDGNAIGGLLGEIFAFEMTPARGTCAACGAEGAVASLVVYAHAPGAVARCPACGAVLLRIVRSEGRMWLDARGLSSLELRPDA